jgi:hypothetical protein
MHELLMDLVKSAVLWHLQTAVHAWMWSAQAQKQQPIALRVPLVTL